MTQNAYVEIMQERLDWCVQNSVQEFENTTGLKSNGSICLCCQGKRQSTLGYKWKYKNN